MSGGHCSLPWGSCTTPVHLFPTPLRLCPQSHGHASQGFSWVCARGSQVQNMGLVHMIYFPVQTTRRDCILLPTTPMNSASIESCDWRCLWPLRPEEKPLGKPGMILIQHVAESKLPWPVDHCSHVGLNEACRIGNRRASAAASHANAQPEAPNLRPFVLLVLWPLGSPSWWMRFATRGRLQTWTVTAN